MVSAGVILVALARVTPADLAGRLPGLGRLADLNFLLVWLFAHQLGFLYADGTLTPEEEQRLHDYYSLDYSPGEGQDTDADDDAVVVRNEELEVGTERRSSGQARLRKRTTTETRTVEVPVTREEIVLEREPVDPDSAEARAADTGPDEVVVETHEEVPVVTKKVSAEKVSLDTATVQDTETVSETIRHDDVDVDRDAAKNNKNSKNRKNSKD